MWWLRDLWDSFWWDEERPSHIVFGGSYDVRRTFKTGNLALIIAIIALIIVIWKL